MARYQVNPLACINDNQLRPSRCRCANEPAGRRLARLSSVRIGHVGLRQPAFGAHGCLMHSSSHGIAIVPSDRTQHSATHVPPVQGQSPFGLQRPKRGLKMSSLQTSSSQTPLHWQSASHNVPGGHGAVAQVVQVSPSDSDSLSVSASYSVSESEGPSVLSPQPHAHANIAGTVAAIAAFLRAIGNRPRL